MEKNTERKTKKKKKRKKSKKKARKRRERRMWVSFFFEGLEPRPWLLRSFHPRPWFGGRRAHKTI